MSKVVKEPRKKGIQLYICFLFDLDAIYFVCPSEFSPSSFLDFDWFEFLTLCPDWLPWGGLHLDTANYFVLYNLDTANLSVFILITQRKSE